MGRPKGLRKINGKWVHTLAPNVSSTPARLGKPTAKVSKALVAALASSGITKRKKTLTQPASETIKARAKRDPEFREALAQEVAPIRETKPKGRPKGSKNKVKPELNPLPVVEAVEEQAKAPEGRKRERDFAWKRNDYTLVKTNNDTSYRPAIVQEITGNNILVKWLGNSPSQFDIIEEQFLFTMGEAI